MDKSFDLLVLDKNFTIVTLLNYTCLQWTRKYYEAGTFSVEIPIELYSSSFKYIYTKDRRELGKIEQINFYIKDGYKSVNLSGYFLEEEVNSRIAYESGNVTNITNKPSWAIKSGKAEDVAFAFFNAFKDVKFTQNNTQRSALLGIKAGISQSRGKTSEHTRGNEQLGNKIYTILKPSKMSYRVNYNYDTSEKVFEVWSGLDRRQNNTAGNNPVIFSTKNGTITNADLLVDTTSYKNSYIVTQGDANTDSYIYLIAGEINTDEEKKFIYVSSSTREEDFSTRANYLNALASEGREKALENPKVISLDFDTIESAYEYLVDFDLGDICSIEIPELEMSEDAVLSGVYEVVKGGVWSMTLEFTTD